MISCRDRDKEYIQIYPSERQLEHQKMEFYGFFHFTVNTFTGREWGDGTESPSIFNPVSFDPGQWAKSIKGAGMKGGILTCKHHDGFCLWPSKYTDHTIAASPYKRGSGDMVKEVAEALRKENLKFGVYLSPWDRNQKTYGYGKAYDDYFVNQLEELLTGYGEIFTVWFDGACGEGDNGKKQFYDFERYYEVIRKLQPQACIAVCGPDVRWCGNEAGDTRPSEWSVVPKRTREAEMIQEKSQKKDDSVFRNEKITSSDLDLGSREVLKEEKELIWYAAEVNTSIRPGWFYHKEEDDKVKTLEELIAIYERSVGGNATFLLNIPPTPEGLVCEEDVKRLKSLGEYLNRTYEQNLIESAVITSKEEEPAHKATMVKDKNETYFKAMDGVTSVEINIKWEQTQRISQVILMEEIQLSQRIESFMLLAKKGLEYEVIYEGTTVGYKKIAHFETVETDEIIIRITDFRVSPTILFVGVYA